MHQYSRRFRVRHYELDSLGHVNNAVYVNYMQEAAVEASTDAGFGPAWYRERSTGWVTSQLSIRYYRPCFYGDELEIKTWLSEIRRASATREYVITRTKDDEPVARARVNWIYLDLTKGQLTRAPAEMITAFAPSGAQDDLGIRLRNPVKTAEAYRYRSRRRVQTYELDPAHHVNHAHYLRWVEQAYYDALRAAGHRAEGTDRESWRAVQGGHDIEYFEPAFEADEIEMTSWVSELGRVRGAWTHEIYCTNRERLLAREYSLGVFVDEEGRPSPAPARVVEEVLRGPSREASDAEK